MGNGRGGSGGGGRSRFEERSGTGCLKRTAINGVTQSSCGEIVAMVGRARRRGKSYATIAAWFGPRNICPPEIQPLLDRVRLLASIEKPAVIQEKSRITNPPTGSNPTAR